MTPIDILHAIVSTEQEARSHYSEALEKQTDFNSFIEEETARLKNEYYRRADAYLAEYDESVVKKANAEIERLDEKLDRGLEETRLKYEARRDSYVEHIYNSVVSADA